MQGKHNFIDFNNLSGFTLSVVLKTINKCLSIAGKHGGCVFGGYVRDVIIPNMITGNDNESVFGSYIRHKFLKGETYPKQQIKFKDVDIWFKDQKSVDNFLEEMGSSLKYNSGFDNPTNELYGFTRKQYYLYEYETCIAWIDVIISEKIPVNDFNVNFLTFSLQNDNEIVISYAEESRNDLINYIINKTAVMLPAYIFKILYDNSSIANSRIRRVKKNYHDKGWRVFLYGSDIEIPSDFTKEWLRETITRKMPSLNTNTDTNNNTNNNTNNMNSTGNIDISADKTSDTKNMVSKEELINAFNTIIKTIDSLTIKNH